MNLKTLKQRLAERYDPDYLVDLLDISATELLDAFPLRLLEKVRDGEFDEVMDVE